MSSSIFIENSLAPKESADSGVIDVSTGDSNLVVVYGKNGISFDQKGLESLIEERKISSISVIRLTSPTPSMEDEEKETEKLEEMLRRQELGSEEGSTACSSDDEANSNGEDEDKPETTSDVNNSSEEQDKTHDEADDNSSEGNKPAENSKCKRIVRRRGRIPNSKKQKIKKKRKRERPEIVGLHVEEFYPPENANEIIKEALKLAGLSTKRQTGEDYEFQLYVIKNDHCYTPFTSPTQMKSKLASEKLSDENILINRKAIQLQTSSSKLVRKKPLTTYQQIDSDVKTSREKLNATFNSSTKSRKDGRDTKSQQVDDCLRDDDDALSSNGEDDEIGDDSEFSETEESAETDNDRDSDLDFDVNNRKGRKRKVKLARQIKRTVNLSKNNNKRRYHNRETSDDIHSMPLVVSSVVAQRSKSTNKSSGSDAMRYSVRSTPVRAAGITVIGQTKGLSAAIAALPPIPKKQVANLPLAERQHTSPNQHRSPATTTANTSYRNSSLGMTTKNTQIYSSPQIRKVIDSPIREFTGSSDSISKSVKTSTIETPSTKVVFSPRPAASKMSLPSLKEDAEKHDVNSQVSIQMNQSTSDLATEHDKQLDLIDSIVKDEMQKFGTIPDEKPSISKNIPELVKMLESTEQALESNNKISKERDGHINSDANKIDSTNTSSIINSIVNPSVGGIDISSAPLLATPDDELPDDILQHVVELIKDDRSLQEAVEKQVFGEDSGETTVSTTGVSTIITDPTPPTLASIFQQTSKTTVPFLQETANSSKSIIQMAISNVPTTLTKESGTTSISTSNNPARITGIHTPKTAPLVRREPIQVIRGNGRIITLPPIEAPTTRAKRRAQALPTTVQSNTNSSNLQQIDHDLSLNSSFVSNASFSILDTNISIEKKTNETVTRKQSVPLLTTQMTSAKSSKKSVSKKAIVSATKHKTHVYSSKPDAETSESHEDDDDPNKLWCICRQPHNNRFMICCDICGDWFHGTCVSITKAMGIEMEQKGIDWTCPKCVKKLEEKKQPKITDMLDRKTANFSILEGENISTIDTESTKGFHKTSSHVATLTAKTTKMISESAVNRQQIEMKKAQIKQMASPKASDNSKISVVLQSSPIGSQKKVVMGSFQTITMKDGPGLKLEESPKVRSAISANASTSVSQSPTDIAISSATTDEPPTICIVCKKVARPNSIYCSDDCIRKHAQNALNSYMTKSTETVTSPQSKIATEEKKKKPKGLFEDVLSMADLKPKIERVSVFERKTGRILTGSNAPTTINLKKWLQENPTFEVIQPGSAQAIDIEKKHKSHQTHSASPTVPKYILNSSGTSSASSIKTLTPTSSLSQKIELSSGNETPRPLKHTMEQVKNTSVSPRPNTPKQLQKYPPQVVIKSDKVSKPIEETKSGKEGKTVKRQTSGEIAASVNKKPTETPSSTDSEPIRLNVRRTLKEQLLLRIKEENCTNNSEFESNNDTKLKEPQKVSQFLSPEEVEEFVKETEVEMYNYFNRDTGAKYKAKYRSLVFNIKDRKNHTLFAKICAKLVEPKQLVRMSPEELASQELAQWREKETKHQLEMIKKSELDLLSCAKNYVLKTHKGEEVIEGKSTDCVNLDLTIPVEDVVSVLNNSSVNSSNVQENSSSTHVDLHSSELDISSSHNTVLDSSTVSEKVHVDEKAILSTVKDKEKERYEDRDHDSDKHQKTRDRHRDKSHSKKRSRSHSHSRSRSRDREKRHKSSRKDDKRDRLERGHEKEHTKEREHIDDSDKKGITPKKDLHSSKASWYMNKEKEKQRENIYSSVITTKKQTVNKSLESFSLVDQILESTKTVEEAANLCPEKEKERDTAKHSTSLPTQSVTARNESPDTSIPTPAEQSTLAVESDQEPSSTVSIPTPPHDPYIRFLEQESSSLSADRKHGTSPTTTLWTGNINMIDVASFQIILQPVVGNALHLGKLLPDELDIVGRIGPDTVWDYISKIKKSPNKEIVVIRLLPANEFETAAYTILYDYLDNRKRLGVIKTTSTHIKDFYIFPLGAGKRMPAILRTVESVDFYEDPYRPDVLIGIVIRVVGKRPSVVVPLPVQHTMNTPACKTTNRVNNSDSFTPPGSPKRKRRHHLSVPIVEEIDIDAIIKAPIAAKSQKVPSLVSSTIDDADEPYSPGGSSDDDMPLLPVKFPASADSTQMAEEDIKRKMDELNRQIAAQEMEIAGLLNVEPSCFATNSPTTSTVLANISIPSNLSQILASIKPSIATQQPQLTAAPPPPLIGSLMKTNKVNVSEEYSPKEAASTTYDASGKRPEKSTSLLAQLSEAELLSMVPDGMIDQTSMSTEPPPPGV